MSKELVKRKYVIAFSTDEFIALVTAVADEAGFDDKKKSHWECTNFSQAVAIFGKEMNLSIEVWSAKVVYQDANGEIKKGQEVDHAFLKIGATFYDFTASQFDDSLPFPLSFKKVPKTYLTPKKIKTATGTTKGSEFWFKKLWDKMHEE